MYSQEEIAGIYLRQYKMVYQICLVLYLHYYQGYTAGEIAQMLGENPSTVRSRLLRARKKLKLRKKTIYRFEDVPKLLETAEGVAVFHIYYGNVYIGFSPSELSAKEILSVVNSIPQIPDKGSAYAEYSDTIVVPGFDLDEPAESAKPSDS